jgi:membrane associated rhomboid family serine protease
MDQHEIQDEKGQYRIIIQGYQPGHQPRYAHPFSGGWMDGTVWFKRLLIANIAMWVIMMISYAIGGDSALEWWFRNIALTPVEVYRNFKVWQIVTSIFMHAPEPTHLFLNMLIFYFFGPRLERERGSKWFIRYFMICGIAGSLLSIIGRGIIGAGDVPGAGASGAVFGIVAAYCFTYERDTILLFFIIPMRALYVFYLLLAFEVAWMLAPGQDDVDHFAHIGGMLAAVAIVKLGWLNLSGGGGRKPRKPKIPRIVKGRRPPPDGKSTDFLEV